MASIQSASTTGDVQETTVLGKRSRGPLTERSTNANPKRSKPAPDSRPRDIENIQPEQDKPTSDSSASVLELTVDNDHLEVDETDVVVFDEDQEDNGEVDDAKAKEQAAQFKNWFRFCDQNDQLTHLSPDERGRRIENCHERFKFMLLSLIKTAQGTKKEEFTNSEAADSPPFTFAWWVFFLKMEPEQVMELLMASLAEPVKVILGGPLTGKELLALPSQWQGCNLWAVYTDVFTRRSGFDHSDVSDPDLARYCGSGTSKDGLESRLEHYENVFFGKRKTEPTTHGSWLVREDVQMNLHVIAVFDQCIADKPYVLLMELLLTILLQAFPSRPSDSGLFRTISALEMIKKATPNDIAKSKHIPLNGAVQSLQGLWYTAREGQSCHNCHATWKRGMARRSAEPGLPFTSWICRACYDYRRAKGVDRPLELETLKLFRHQFKQMVGEKPAPGEPCPGCLRSTIVRCGGPQKEIILRNPLENGGSASHVSANQQLNFHSIPQKASPSERGLITLGPSHLEVSRVPRVSEFRALPSGESQKETMPLSLLGSGGSAKPASVSRRLNCRFLTQSQWLEEY